MRHGRGRTLTDRVAIERRVGSDGTPGLWVGNAGDGVGHLLVIPVHGDLQTALRSRLDQSVSGFLYTGLDVVHDPPSSRCRSTKGRDLTPPHSRKAQPRSGSLPLSGVRAATR